MSIRQKIRERAILLSIKHELEIAFIILIAGTGILIAGVIVLSVIVLTTIF